MVQLANAVASDPGDRTRVVMVCYHRTAGDAILRDALVKLAAGSSGRVQVHVVLTGDAGASSTPAGVPDGAILAGRINSEHVLRLLPPVRPAPAARHAHPHPRCWLLRCKRAWQCCGAALMALMRRPGGRCGRLDSPMLETCCSSIDHGRGQASHLHCARPHLLQCCRGASKLTVKPTSCENLRQWLHCVQLYTERHWLPFMKWPNHVTAAQHTARARAALPAPKSPPLIVLVASAAGHGQS